MAKIPKFKGKPAPTRVIKLALIPYLLLIGGVGGWVIFRALRTELFIENKLSPLRSLCDMVLRASDAVEHSLALHRVGDRDLALDRYALTEEARARSLMDANEAIGSDPRLRDLHAAVQELQTFGVRLETLEREKLAEAPGEGDGLNATDYLEARQRYLGSLTRFDDLLALQTDAAFEAFRIVGIQAAVVIVFMVAGLILIWIGILRSLNQYHRERNRVEEALRESERRFRALVENVPVGVYRLKPGAHGGFVAANATMARMFGYDSEEEFLTADVSNLYADEALRKEFAHRLRTEGRVVGAELLLRKRDGSTMWARISANVIRDAGGNILYVDGIEEDITEQRQAEAQLRASEERYRFLAENARDVIVVLGLDLKMNYVGPSVIRLTGFTPEETLARPLDQILTPASLEFITRTFAEEMRIEQTPSAPGYDPARSRLVELEMLRSDGSSVWVEVRASFVRDAQGRPTGLLGAIRDTTDRRLAAEALRRSEERYRQIIQTADEGIWIIEVERKTSFVNAKMADMLGAAPERILGRSLRDFIAGDAAPFDRMRETLRAGQRARIDIRLRREGGEEFWALLSASPMFDEHERFAGALVMVTDITERKRAEDALRASESRFRLLAENSRDLIWLTDLDLRLSYASPAIERLLGIPVDQALGMSLEQAVAPASLPLFSRALTEETEIEGSGTADPARTRTLEVEALHRDGTTFWTEMQVSFVRDEQGRPVGLQGSLRDIVARKSAEEALRKSEELYRGMIETSDEGIWILDEENRVSFLNSKIAAMLGHTEADLLGQAHTQFMTAEGRRVEEANDRLRRQGIKTHADVRFERRDGTDFWASVSANPMFGPDGRYTGMLAMISDITDRKRAEEGSKILAAVSSLFLTGKDINMAIDTVLEMVGRFDGADRAYVYYLSAEGERMSEVYEWCDEGIRSERDRLQGLETGPFNWFLAQLRRGQSVTIPDVGSLPPGNFREHLLGLQVQSMICFPVFIDGKFEGFCGFDLVTSRRDWSASDVSVLRQTAELIGRGVERKRAEEALRNSESLYTSLVDHLPLSVFRKDPQGRFTFANWNFCQMVGRALEDILGRTDADFFPADLVSKYRADDERILATGEIFDDEEEYQAPADTAAQTVHVIKSPVRDIRGRIAGIQGIIWDITERRNAEEAVRAASRMEATATLAGGIAHDFNNLMVGIMGNADILQAMFREQPEVLRKLKIVSDAARKGGDLAQKLLAYARGGNTTQTLVSLSSIVQEAVALQERSIPPRIKLSCDLPAELYNVKADPAQLAQVIMNLCINAVEAIEGDGTIRISAENLDVDYAFARSHRGLKPGPHVRIDVADTGAGMTPQIRSRVFEPFFTTKFQGRGLGLAASYGIVRNHGGMIAVESEPGEGSTFRVYLPAMSLKSYVPSQQQALPVQTPKTNSAKKVLVVDDDSTVLTVATRSLQSAGVATEAFTTGQAGLDRLAAAPTSFDIAFLDLDLPDMQGDAFLPQALALAPHLKIVLLTGTEFGPRIERMLRHGAAAYIPKPYRPQDLQRTVDAIRSDEAIPKLH